MNDTVALTGCESYNRAVIEEKVARLFDLLGGPSAFAGPGQSVFVKVNAVIGAAPEKGITTHPEVVRAVVNQFKKVTDRVTIGDSPGGPFTPAYLRRVYEKCGYAAVARETGAELGLDTSTKQVTISDGKALKAIAVCKAMADADCLVSVSKLKTHMFLNITAAIKNMFGAVPGGNKFTYHSRFTRDTDFADLIVDVLLASAPDLNIVEAVVAMDGNGPRAGNLIDVGLLAGGRDAMAIDAVLMDVIGIEAKMNKPLAAATRRGLWTGDLDGVEVVGDSVAVLAYSGFRLPTKKDISEHVPEFIMKRFGDHMALRPVPVAGKCTACGKCVEICPAHAVTVVDKIARVDLKKCQACYCCHELCEHDAIALERPMLMKLLRINRDLA
ncbi:MAG TPA: DUF362 domain-containing protein [Candidatus Anoxymicrobiaceae bacterium]